MGPGADGEPVPPRPLGAPVLSKSPKSPKSSKSKSSKSKSSSPNGPKGESPKSKSSSPSNSSSKGLRAKSSSPNSELSSSPSRSLSADDESPSPEPPPDPMSAASADELSGPASCRATTDPIPTMPATTAAMAAVLPTAGAMLRSLPSRPPLPADRRPPGGGTADEDAAELASADEQEQRQHGPGQRAVDVLELCDERSARLAALQVLVDRGGVARRQPAPHVAAELRAEGLVIGRGRGEQVGLEVGLAQLLACPVRHGRGGVGRHAEGVGQLAGLAALDRGLPQHGLPPVGERLEGLGDQRAVGLLERRRVGGGGDRLGHVVERLLGRLGGHLGRVPAQRDEQVGTERVGGPGAPADRAEDPFERRVDEVVGVAEPPVGAREPQRRRLMSDVQLGERCLVAVACLVEQLGVSERRDRHGRDLRASVAQSRLDHHPPPPRRDARRADAGSEEIRKCSWNRVMDGRRTPSHPA